MRTKKEKNLVLLSFGILIVFFIVVAIIFFSNRDSEENVSVSSNDTSVLEYQNSEVSNAYNIDSEEKVIIVKKSKAILSNDDIIYCVSCSFIKDYNDDLTFLSGTAIVHKNGFGYIYIKDKRVGVNGSSYVIIKTDSQQVVPVEGQVYLDETLEEVSGQNKAVYLVDSFQSRATSNEDFTESETRSIVYFMFDINELPKSLEKYSPISSFL